MNKKNLLKKIRKEFPGLHWKKAQHNIEGWDHYVLILDDTYVFRFPRTKEYLKRLQNEIALLTHLKNKVTILVPEYSYIAKDKSFAGYVMIRGIQLKKEKFEKLPDRTRHVIARQIAELSPATETLFPGS